MTTRPSRVFTERAILPNTTGAYILRVYDDSSTQELSIVAWRVEWTKDRRENGSEIDASSPWPITIEDDYDGISNAIEFIVDRETYVVACETFFTAREDAILYAQQTFAARRGRT